jgi:hypothetical protein
MDELDNMLGALTGAGLAALTQWSRLDDTTQSKLRNVRADVRDVRDAFVDTQSYGEIIRLRLAVVQDLLSGVARASSTSAAPSPLPLPQSSLGRPDLCSGIEAAISGFSYPPRQGTYDARGNIVSLGELTTVGTALTFEEVRAALHGFVMCGGSTGSQRVEIYRAMNALVETVAGLSLSKAEFASAWARVFAMSSPTSIDPHLDPARPPSLSIVNSAAITLSFLGAPPIGTNPQTDAAQRITFSVNGGAIAAETDLVSVAFAMPYRWKRSDGTVVALTPAITVNSSYRTFRVTGASNTGYRLACINGLASGDSIDLLVSVNPGIATA